MLRKPPTRTIIDHEALLGELSANGPGLYEITQAQVRTLSNIQHTKRNGLSVKVRRARTFSQSAFSLELVPSKALKVQQ